MQIHNDEQFSFYVIEGVDGAGKSTLGQLLSSKIGGIHYETPSKIFKPSQPLIDQSASVNAQFLFYLSANAQASNDITTMRANQPVVCVRYIYSTIAYHVAKGLELDWAISLINSTNLVLPSKVFLLDISENKQIERLNKRGFSAEDRRNLDKMSKIKKIYKDLARILPNFILINTDNLAPNDVLHLVLGELKLN